MKRTAIAIGARRYLPLLRETTRQKLGWSDFSVLSTEQIHEDLRSFLRRNCRHYDGAVLFTPSLDTQRVPIVWAFIVCWISSRGGYFIDLRGRLLRVTFSHILFHYLPRFLWETGSIPLLFLRAMQNLRDLREGRPRRNPGGQAPLRDQSHGKTRRDLPLVAYLRTDHWFGPGKAGGAMAHLKGVVGGLKEMGYPLLVLSTDRLEVIEEEKIPVFVIEPRGKIRNFYELPELEYNSQMVGRAREILRRENPGVIYQRYSLNNYCGAQLAKELEVPFVLEYNGSFLWTAKHWDNPLWFKNMAGRIERLNLEAADLIVVVSEPMRDELVGRGIGGDKIVVNPNGVDPDRFRPDIDGSGVRKAYGLENRLVMGFIGTFGPWHGAEVLAEAIRMLSVREGPGTRGSPHFLFMGDGPLLEKVQSMLRSEESAGALTFTGLIPQESAPEYLAACDVLISPHVPNPDGTAFFGSPTKLFEYMAMGKPIIASRLGQIGEILEHEKTALLVRPGDPRSLAEAIERVRDRYEDFAVLGENARKEVMARYTWRHHVARIVHRLGGILPEG